MSLDKPLSRRSFLSFSALTAASALAGCASTSNTVENGGMQISYRSPFRPFQTTSVPGEAELAVMYGPIEDGGFLIPAVPYQQIDPRY